MKLVIAIIQDEDTPALTDALVSAEHRCQSQYDGLILAHRQYQPSYWCRRRSGTDGAGDPAALRIAAMVPYSPALEPGLLYMPENFEVEVGGAVVFVIDVARFERL